MNDTSLFELERLDLHATYINGINDSLLSETSPLGLMFDAMPEMLKNDWLNIDDVVKHLPTIAKPSISITKIDKEPVLDLGDVSTIEKRPRNTTPIPLPSKFGEVIHMDIGFGSKTAITGVKYCLFLID